MLLFVAVIVFLLNLPFGYWRQSVRKFSLQWALAIHLPIPLVVLLRIESHIGFQLISYPVLLLAFFGGQYVGATMRRHRGVVVSTA